MKYGELTASKSNPRIWISWAGLLFVAAIYLVLNPRLATGGTLLSLGLVIILGALCRYSRNGAPFLIFFALLYIIPNPTGSNEFITIIIIMSWMVAKRELIRSRSQTDAGQYQTSLLVLFLLIAGFVTSLPEVILSERFGETLMREMRCVAIFVALPFLSERWLKQHQIRQCISIIASFLTLYYSYMIFSVAGTLAADTSRLDSVQGEIEIGARTIILSRTFTGPTLAISCCALWGFIITERRYLLKGLTLAVFVLGFSALIYTGARGALGSAVIICFFVTCLLAWQQRRLNVVVGAAILFLGLIYLLNVWLPQVWAVLELRLGKTSFSAGEYDRIPRWLWSFDYFCSHPLGVGWTLTPLDPYRACTQ